jgi:hypothetical protein
MPVVHSQMPVDRNKANVLVVRLLAAHHPVVAAVAAA